MSLNLIDSLKGYITPEIITKASSLLGESENGTKNAITAAIPTLLSGLLNKSGDAGVMGSVMDLVTKNSNNSDGILSNITGLLSGNDTATSGIGSSLLNMVFGNKISAVTDVISNASGVKSSSVGSVLGMVGPMILGYLGKSGTTASGLTSLLASQKSSILGALPTGLASAAGFSSEFSNNINTNISTNSSEKSGNGMPKWLLPLLLLLAGLAAVYFFTKGCNKKDITAPAIEKIDSISAAADTLASATSEAVEDATSALGKFFSFKLPNGVELNAPENGIENKVVTWMNDKTKVVDKTTWFNFDRLLFETGKSTLQPTSQEQLKNIAEIMKAYPTMEVKLGGYTDNTGDAASNLKLSAERAKSVMAELVKLGVAEKRVSSEGFGIQFPVASNDTEEGRAQNRRIAVRITKK